MIGILIGLGALGALAVAALAGGSKSTAQPGSAYSPAGEALPASLAISVRQAQANPTALGYEGMMNLQQQVRAAGFPKTADAIVQQAQLLPGAPPVPVASLMIAALQSDSKTTMRAAADALEAAGYMYHATQLRSAAEYGSNP